MQIVKNPLTDFEKNFKIGKNMCSKKQIKSVALIILVIILLSIASVPSTIAQAVQVLTLQESINIALNKSQQIKSLKQDLNNSLMSLKAAEAGFKSNSEFVLSSFPTYYESETRIPTPDGDFSFSPQKYFIMKGELYINQPISWTDGTFSLVGSLERFQQLGTFTRTTYGFDPKTFQIDTITTVEKDPFDFSPRLSLQYRQPLFTINRLKIGYLKAKLALESTEMSYTRSELDIVYQVTSAFYQLYQGARQVEIDNESMEQSEKAYNLALKKVQAGLIPEVDAMQLEVDFERSKNTLVASEANLKRMEDAFKVLIGIDIDQEVRVTAQLDYHPIEVAFERALQEALKRRTEFQEDEINVTLAEIGVKETDANTEFRGDLYLRYGIWNRQKDFQDSFTERFDNDRQVLMQLTVPLWDWKRNRYQVEASKARLENARITSKHRIQQIKKEVRDAVLSLKEARQRVEISERSVALAEKTYKIRFLFFENGEISSQELALEQDRLTAAKTDYLAALIAYKQAVTDLTRKTLWDFEKNQPVKVLGAAD